VRINCPHCAIILNLPMETIKFIRAKCEAVCIISSSSNQDTMPEDVFQQAGLVAPITPLPLPMKGGGVTYEQFMGYLLLEIRELKRQIIENNAVKLECC